MATLMARSYRASVHAPSCSRRYDTRLTEIDTKKSFNGVNSVSISLASAVFDARRMIKLLDSEETVDLRIENVPCINGFLNSRELPLSGFFEWSR